MGLLEMSISAGVLILLLALLRRERLWHLSRRTMMLLWMVALARLLLPGSLPMRKGIAVPVFAWMRQVCGLHAGMAGQADGNAAVRMVSKAASFGTQGYLQIPVQEMAGFIWLAGMIACGIYFVCCYRRECRLLAQALPLEGLPSAVRMQIQEAYESAARLAGMRPQKRTIRLLVHDRIHSPLVFGSIRQSIIIPKSLLYLHRQQMQHILTHEIVHIRRFDNLWKLLSAAAVCIHWFNPTVWLMYRLFARDLELSCDEQALSAYGSRGRQQYAVTLFMLAQNQKKTALFCSGFFENPVKERMESIMNYKKITGIGVVCAVMLLAGASSVFATNEQTNLMQEKKETLRDADAAAQNADEEDLVEYEIMKSEYGKDVTEKSGSAKIINQDDKKDENAGNDVNTENNVNTENDEEEIILRVCDENENQQELDNLWITFQSEQETEGKTEIVSSENIEQNIGELEPGKTYKYIKSQKKFEAIDSDSVSNAQVSGPELVESETQNNK